MKLSNVHVVSRQEYRCALTSWRYILYMNFFTFFGHFQAPSLVLLKQDKSFHTFGYQAERKYISLVDGKQQDQWYYFKRFKADLKTKVKLNETF